MGALPLPWLVLLSLWVAIQALRRTEHIFIRGMSFAAVMAIVSLLIHSLVDFNLQIPANALMFVFMLSVCWLTRYLSDETSDEQQTIGHAEADRRDFGQSRRCRGRYRGSRSPATQDALSL